MNNTNLFIKKNKIVKLPWLVKIQRKRAKCICGMREHADPARVVPGRYDESLYVGDFNNLEEINKFSEYNYLPKLIKENININNPVNIRKILSL